MIEIHVSPRPRELGKHLAELQNEPSDRGSESHVFERELVVTAIPPALLKVEGISEVFGWPVELSWIGPSQTTSGHINSLLSSALLCAYVQWRMLRI